MPDFQALRQLPAAMIKNLDSLGYHAMTQIQSESLPLSLAGRDLIAQAQTGSGKTAAFSLPLLLRINQRDFGSQALVLCPTRELSTQVAAEIRRLARYQDNIKVVTLCGGQPIGPQIGSLEHGAHIVVGTPGRIKDHLRKQTLDISRVETVVLDEADRMLDMGFMEDMEQILAATPESRQTLLFSATFPDNIRRISSRFQQDPAHIVITPSSQRNQIEQHLYLCRSAEKPEMLLKLLAHYQPEQSIVFCNTRQLTQDITDTLLDMGVAASALHGDMDQKERDKALVCFRQQSSQVLVATDVAARGIDIDDLAAVINYELPRDPDVYTHRIGRTGRAGRDGLALSLFTEAEQHKLVRMFDHPDDIPPLRSAADLSGGRQPMSPPRFITLEIAAGRKQKIRPGDILGALTGDAGLEGSEVGKIDILDYVSFVAVVSSQSRKALGRLNNGRIKGRRLKVRQC